MRADQFPVASLPHLVPVCSWRWRCWADRSGWSSSQTCVSWQGWAAPGHTSTISTQILGAKPKAMHRQAGYRFVWRAMVWRLSGPHTQLRSMPDFKILPCNAQWRNWGVWGDIYSGFFPKCAKCATAHMHSYTLDQQNSKGINPVISFIPWRNKDFEFVSPVSTQCHARHPSHCFCLPAQNRWSPTNIRKYSAILKNLNNIRYWYIIQSVYANLFIFRSVLWE